MPADRSEGRVRPPRCLTLVTGLALATAPTSLRAAPAGEPEASDPATVEGPAPASDPPIPRSEPDAVEPGTSEGEGRDEVEVEVEEPEAPSGGGMIGSVVDPDDPNAARAQSDLEGENLERKADGVPDRLPKLQTAGWWLMFGGVTLAAAGGVLAGVAETREDDAERLAYGFDLMTGSSTLYGSVADEYEQTLREGVAFQNAARGLIVGGAVVVLAGVGSFIAQAVQNKNERGRAESARVRIESGPRGWAVRF